MKMKASCCPESSGSSALLREETHNFFFSGRTAKGVGRLNPFDH